MSEDQGVNNEQDTEQDDDLKDSFLKGDDKDNHRIASALGRFLKNQGDQDKFNQKVMDTLSKLEQHLATPPKNTNTDIAKINEDWQDRILKGDIISVLDEFTSLKTRAETEISQANMTKVDQLVGSLSEDPFFDKLEKVVRERSIGLVQQGKDPQTAVDLAYNKARADYFGGLIASVHKTNPNALKLATGGSKADLGESKGKLPEHFKQRMAKDMKEAPDLFKTEADWIASLAPQLRNELGV